MLIVLDSPGGKTNHEGKEFCAGINLNDVDPQMAVYMRTQRGPC